MDPYDSARAQQQLGRGGSVRAARERMEDLKRQGNGIATTQQSLEQRAFREPRTVPNPRSAPGRNQGSMLPEPQQAVKNGLAGRAVISRPIVQNQQWPLNSQGSAGNRRGPDPQEYTPPSSRESSRRPARPNFAPPMFEPNRQFYQSQNQNQNQNYNLSPNDQRRYHRQDYDDGASSHYSTPLSPPSRALSTVSSMGSIPDFPVPQLVAVNPPRRSANLGPPPSARRGPPSSYYSNNNYVSPIPEENSDRAKSRGSYASSSAIPSSWGDESPGLHFGYETEDQFSPDIVEERRGSEDSDRQDQDLEDNDERGLVRSASVGRRSRPTMVITRSSSGGLAQAEKSKRRSTDDIALETLGASVGSKGTRNMAPGPSVGLSPRDAQRETVWPISEGRHTPRSPLGQGTEEDGLISPSGTIPIMMGRTVTSDSATLGALAPPRMSRLFPPDNQVLPGDVTPIAPVRTKGLSSRLSALRRPPKLDIDAVREAEKRGSLTSLPDLIKRATRLAYLMDKGKRPGSRLHGLNMFSAEEDGEKNMGHTKHNSGLSGMLAAFPPPGTISSPRNSEKAHRPDSSWPEDYAPSTDSRDIGTQGREVGAAKPGRRCCGMPLWGFIMLLIVLLIIIAAAVVIPLKLLVLDKESAAAYTSSPDLASCQNSTTCANDGSVVVVNGACSCICTNGYSGSNCTTLGASGCSSMSMMNGATGTTMNVTLGSTIDRLITGGNANYSIPLVATALIAKFNAVNLSCTAQNALVTFDGSATRDGSSDSTPVEVSSSTTASAILTAGVTGITPDAILTARDGLIAGQQTDIIPGSTIAISIIFPSQSTTSKASTETITRTTGAATPLSTTSTATTSTAAPDITTSTTASTATSMIMTEDLLDFARVVTLYVLQQETLDFAVSAQSALQTFFNGAVNGGFSVAMLAKAGNLTIGGGDNSVDFMNETVDLGSGIIGGRTTGTGSKKRSPRSV